jgi:hypothetical protein
MYVSVGKRPNRIHDPRVAIPPYLTDSDYAAPCICGKAFSPDSPAVLVEGETGLRRYMHISCLPPDMMGEVDEA